MLIHHDVDLRPFNSFGVSAKAKEFIVLQDLEALKQLGGFQAYDKYLLLGEGSNVLFVNDFEGTIIQNQLRYRDIIPIQDGFTEVGVGAGENWHEFVLWCLEHNLGGLENLSLIPGSVGAAPIQNIGAYGVEVKDRISRIEVYDLKDQTIKFLSVSDCGFAYRWSNFKGKWKGRFLITKVFFKLSTAHHELNTSYGAIQTALDQKKIKHPGIGDVAKAVISIRQSKLPDPKLLGNAGSFFKNPIVTKQVLEDIRHKMPEVPSYPVDEAQVKLPAGWLIEKSGWRGKRIGWVGTSPQQALVIVNYGKATGQEIWAFAQQILKAVVEQFNIELEPEVNIIC